MDSVLAQAMPTPTMLSSSRYLLCMNITEVRPAEPHNRHKLCVCFLPSFLARRGKANENAKQTAEYAAKQTPPHSTPARYSGELGSVPPKTLRATATGK